MSAIEARFYVAERHAYPGNGGKVILRAACRGDQNRKWAQATPGGTIEMSVNNPAALAEFDRWLAEGLDVQVILQPVAVARPDDGHAFRPAEQEPGQSWPQPSQCGECGATEAAHAAAD